MDLIYPEIFRNEKNVECMFTTACKTSSVHDGDKRGLNFGLNTDDEDHIISKNLYHLFANLGWKQQMIAFAKQVHGNQIACVEEPGIYKDCDGLVTTRPGLPLAIQTADCAAVLIADPEKNVVGAFHAGWRGALANIVANGIKAMKRMNAVPENCLAYISPCISLEHFEVGEEVAAQFPEEFCDRKHFSKPHINLKKFIHRQLLDCGLSAAKIEISDECTVSNHRFFSFRRERSAAGRMLGIIKIKS